VLLVLSKSASLFHPLVIRGKLHSHVLALPFERGHTFLAKIIRQTHTGMAWQMAWLSSLSLLANSSVPQKASLSSKSYPKRWAKEGLISLVSL
jgi:hypothetical protein